MLTLLNHEMWTVDIELTTLEKVSDLFHLRDSAIQQVPVPPT